MYAECKSHNIQSSPQLRLELSYIRRLLQFPRLSPSSSWIHFPEAQKKCTSSDLVYAEKMFHPWRARDMYGDFGYPRAQL
nr:hypothetical protein Iba_chr10eCG6150 [Ipomoea batatas]